MEKNTQSKDASIDREGMQKKSTRLKSKDGTWIAFNKTGTGPAIIIVNGALSYRAVYDDKFLVSALSKDFTIYTYDRRGRGESTDTSQYDVEREIEDIEALIKDAGGLSLFVWCFFRRSTIPPFCSQVGRSKNPQTSVV